MHQNHLVTSPKQGIFSTARSKTQFTDAYNQVDNLMSVPGHSRLVKERWCICTGVTCAGRRLLYANNLSPYDTVPELSAQSKIFAINPVAYAC